MYTDDGYKCYSFTLTTDIMPWREQTEKDDFVRYAKYSLFTFFNEKLGRIQVQDFLVHGQARDINI